MEFNSKTHLIMGNLKKSPRLADRLLRLLCSSEIYDELKGDLEETYLWRSQRNGPKYARFRYYLDVLSAIRFIRMKDNSNSFSRSMLYSFVKSSFRNFSKHKFQTFLNVFGLAVGITAALFILEYVSDELNYDRFSQSDDMYRVTLSFSRGDELMYKTAVIGEPIAEAMLNELPQVEKAARLLDITRVWEGKNILTIENQPDKTFEEPDLFFADPDIIDLFDLDMAFGRSRLDEPNTIILSRALAEKYFDAAQDAVGKMIRFQSVRKKHELLVTGVYEYPDFNMQVRPSALISYVTNLSSGKKSIIPMWGVNTCLTYVKVKPGTGLEMLQKALTDLLRKYQPLVDKRKSGMHISNLMISPVASVHLNSTYQDEVGPTGNANTIFVLTVIAFFIVTMAWINYINLSTANSMRRSKEVGVRKVMGARRDELIIQFFIETFLVNLLALSLAIGLVLLTQPLFDQLVGRSLHLSTIDLPRFGIIMAGVFLAGIFVSGLYAAVVLSSQRAIRALKGVSKGNSGQNLRRGLIVFQLLFSSVLIMISLALEQQLRFMNNTDIGMEMDKVLVLEGPTIKRLDSTHIQVSELLVNRLSGLSNVKNVSVTNTIPGKSILQSSSMSRDNSIDAERHEIEIIVGSQYLDVLQTKLIAGKGFDPDLERRQVILNASAARQLGFTGPEDTVGKLVYSGGPEGILVRGIIEDYHHESLNRPIDPMAFYNRVGRWDNYYLLKLHSENTRTVFTEVEKIYAEMFPGNPVKYYYLDQFFNSQYGNERMNSRIFMGFVLIAIIVACLGLYGLTSFAALQRTKEIGVRKVLGAKVNQIFFMLSREVMLLSLLGFLLATPLAYYGIGKWLDNYAYHIQMSWWLFVIPMVMILMVTMMAIAQKIIKTALTNPVNSLRNE